jgi:hypothetical protein
VAPTIRIDDELYALLKEHAEPFTDSPNDVLWRLIGRPRPNGSSRTETKDESGATAADTPARSPKRDGKGKEGQKRRRAAKGTLLPMAEYELPLVQVLAEAGGRAPAREAIEAIGSRLADKFTEGDRQRGLGADRQGRGAG